MDRKSSSRGLCGKKIWQYLILRMLWYSSQATSIQFSVCVCVCVCVCVTQASSFKLEPWSALSPLPSESKISCSIPLVQIVSVCVCVCVPACVFIRLFVAARGRDGHYSNPVKTPLLMFYLIEYILWRLCGNDRTCAIFLFYSDEVFCLSQYGAHHTNQSKFLTMASIRSASEKLHYMFIPDRRE